MKKIRINHGMSNLPEYQVWLDMKKRCYNPKQMYYESYGGRGITVCDKWLHSFPTFYSDLGQRPTPKHTIERIDSDKNYEPSNVKWATRKEQANNCRHNHLITFNGETLTLVQWSEKLGINYSTLRSRINRKQWSLERSMTCLL